MKEIQFLIILYNPLLIMTHLVEGIISAISTTSNDSSSTLSTAERLSPVGDVPSISLDTGDVDIKPTVQNNVNQNVVKPLQRTYRLSSLYRRSCPPTKTFESLSTETTSYYEKSPVANDPRLGESHNGAVPGFVPVTNVTGTNVSETNVGEESVSTQPYQCLEQLCGVTTCLNQTVRSTNYCANHVCQANSTCSNSNENGFYCLEHRCEGFINGDIRPYSAGPCHEKKFYDKYNETYYSYCSNCLCQHQSLNSDDDDDEQCPNNRCGDMSRYCRYHMMVSCEVPECDGLVSRYGNKFCQEHRCLNQSGNGQCSRPRFIDSTRRVVGYYCAECMCTELANGVGCNELAFAHGKCQYHYFQDWRLKEFMQCQTHYCPNLRQQDSPFCGNCGCRAPGCNESRPVGSSSVFCTRHTCVESGCNLPCEQSYYCDIHRCQHEDDLGMCQNRCTNTPTTNLGGKYCNQHGCAMDKCTLMASKFSRYCIEHRCQQAMGRGLEQRCKNNVLGEQYFCSDHICRYGDCEEPRVVDSNFCETHERW